MIDYKKLKQVIDNLPNDELILLSGHKNTDYDSICSTLCMTQFLNKIGKKAYMLLEENDIEKLNWYGGYQYIISQYDDSNYNFILLDSNRKSRLGIFEKYFDKANITINIDHHENNNKESKYIFVDENISSTCEIVYNLINEYENVFDKDVATLIYAGIVSDTNMFYKRINPATMLVISNLLNYNIDSEYIVKNVYKNMSLEESKILSDMISKIEYDTFYYILLDRENELYKNIDYSVIFKKCASIIYDIKDIHILGIFLKELDGSISGLFRSNCSINVDELAIKLGGGGHKKASGFENNVDINDVLEISKEYIKRCNNEKDNK